MHEASIAQAIVDTILDQAKKQNAKAVQSVQIEIGELTFLNEEQVGFWVKLGLENTLASDADIQFKRIKARLKCGACEFEGDLGVVEDPVYHMRLPTFACPQCKSADIRISQGKEAIVRSIRIIKD